MIRRASLALFVVAALSASVSQAQRAGSTGQVEWLHWGGDPGGMKYTPLTDINADNLGRLELAWQWKHWETPLDEYKTIPGFFESTPLMIDGVLYVTTPYNSIAALDAETGKELWRFDGEAYKLGQVLSGSGFKHRGPAFWRDGNQLRIVMNSRHRLVSLDARTGKPVPSFAANGFLPLTEGPHISQSSPPTIYKDLIILGSQIPDRLIGREEVGEVRAFDARTGEPRWTFSIIPQSADDPAAATWENESWRNGSHANAWAPMALDEARGLLYVPTSTPNNDYYGGTRPGANLYAESLVCLDAATGKVKWHFQTVHHGIWDYDVPTQPNLVTITVNGKRIDAVAQITKQGFTFVFDRVTGTPIWPIEERAVPTDTDIPGEKVYPTQPFPIEAARLCRPGRLARRREQPDAGDQGDGAGSDEEVPHRPAVSAARARRDAAASRSCTAAPTGAAPRSTRSLATCTSGPITPSASTRAGAIRSPRRAPVPRAPTTPAPLPRCPAVCR